MADSQPGKKRNVALIIETSNGYARGLLHGIRDFLQESTIWSIYLAEHSRHETDHSFPEDWAGDGVIARIETEPIAELVRHMRVPVVDVSAARLVRGIPWVETDDEEITRLVVHHFESRGIRNVAFLGDPYYNWSRWRQQTFEKIMVERRSNAIVYNLPVRSTPQVIWAQERAGIFSWLRTLPKPIGVFACYDTCAQQLLEVCRFHDVRVPTDVAVVGVDNDELMCDLSYPTLTSVIPNARLTGFFAASLLDRMMNGEYLEERKYSIKPVGIQERVSTDVLAVEDPDISKAIRFIRAHSHTNIKVEDVLHIVPLSRRVFEKRFKQALGWTPHQEILDSRVSHIKRILVETDATLAEIAEMTGFEHPEYLSVAFKRVTGLTPSEFRTQVKDIPHILAKG